MVALRYYLTALGSLLKRIRFMTVGHNVPLKLLNGASKRSSPYQIFFNLYKPSTPFKKSAPPPPIKLVVFQYLFIFSNRSIQCADNSNANAPRTYGPLRCSPPPRQRRQLLGASNATAALKLVQPPMQEISSQTAAYTDS